MKFPLGTNSFDTIRKGGYVYVDKTAYVYKMANESITYFLGRPRRFGKSLLMSTFQAYFEGRKELFEGLAIEKLEKEWKAYPVLRFDFNGKVYKRKGALEEALDEQLLKYEKKYLTDRPFKSLDGRLNYLVEQAYEQTGLKAVILVDEYDKPLLDALDTPLEAENRETLKGFYSAFKRADESLRFVFFTGVTKFSQVSVFSGFNQIDDISMIPQYDAICGITEDELNSIFSGRIAEFAEQEECSVEEMKRILKWQYDGYHFSEGMTDVYNPFSILKALCYLKIGDTWFNSGTPEYLVRLLSHTDANIKEIIDGSYSAALFADYKANVQLPLPMIYQSGYLTIKEYDKRNKLYKLDFPNEEVRKGFIPLISAGYFKNDNDNLSTIAQMMDNCLRDGKTEEFMKHFNAYLAGIPYNVHGPLKDGEAKEKFFQLVFFLVMSLMGNRDRIFSEEESARGRADCVIKYADYVYVFEFKVDGSAEKALKQIDEKGYAEPYATDSRKVIKVGINFSSEKRVITEWLAEPADF